MRIISGTSKGRKLAALRNQSLRPTSDRVKESLFNILGRGIEDKTVLDLFAGTGNLGMEALSRGAKKAIFVEKNRQALQLIRKNLTRLGLGERSEVLPKEVDRAIAFLKKRESCFDLILMDPPYEKGLIQKTLLRLNAHPIYHESSILVVEHTRREPLPSVLEGWTLIRQRSTGDTIVSFLMPQTDHGGFEG
jgi:16S rRNA (guanine966-N2)-methyltransferase